MKTIALIGIAFLLCSCASAPRAGTRNLNHDCNAVSDTAEFVCMTAEKTRGVQTACDKVSNDLGEFVCAQPK